MKIKLRNKHDSGILLLVVVGALLLVTGGVAVWLWLSPIETTPTSPAGQYNDALTNLPSMGDT
jgi:hypothetical protein